MYMCKSSDCTLPYIQAIHLTKINEWDRSVSVWCMLDCKQELVSNNLLKIVVTILTKGHTWIHQEYYHPMLSACLSV